ncbi:MAG: YHS domain-containing (seleno)protein [Maricaulaceae bacterium]|jgi:YHS domain-containing protein
MKTIKTLLAATTLLCAVSAGSAALAEDEYNTSTGTTLTGAGVALRGDDAVALATGLDVTAGDATFTFERDGVAYYFASEETMNQFAADPEAFMPQFGGFCAFGVAINRKLDADPHYADIVDGKLYVFLNAVAFGKYLDDKEGTLELAYANWPGMHHVTVEEVNAAADSAS